MNNSSANDAVQELESPFLHLTNFTQKLPKPEAINSISTASPFKSVYELEGIEQVNDGENESLVEIMDEIYDEEFEVLLQEIAREAQDLYESQPGSQYVGMQNHETMVRQSINHHFTPFLNELERFMGYVEEVADRHDTQTMTDEEWEHKIEQFASQIPTSPAFEDFGGWLKKVGNKIKKVAKVARKVVNKGVGLAKKLGLGFIIKRLNNYIFKFLKGFLLKGITKLPEQYRPIAKKLAQKIGILKEVDEYSDNEVYFQQEMDTVISELLLAPNEMEFEIIEQEFLNEADILPENPLDQLDAARENFIKQLAEMQEGENPEPAVEEFVPAVLMGLKWGIKIVGREKVKKIVSDLTARLIQKYIGKKYASMLSKQLVGTGFKLLNLELAPEDEVDDGNRAIAAVVEDTVRQVSQMPEYIIQNEALLETNVIQAFESSAKANFPDILSEEVYKSRPDLREAANHKVAWIMKTMGKGRRKRCRYKKLNKEIETELTPYLAEEIKTFGGISLGNILRDQVGVIVNRKIPVKVHIYETLPGADRFDIGKNEIIIPGTNSSSIRAGWQHIHPLTSIAAGLLLGEPALGCKLRSKCLSNRRSRMAHRYYYLEIPGARPRMYSTPSGMLELRKTTELRIKLNFIRNRIQLFLFLSESDAQGIATHMRQNIGNNAARLGTLLFEAGLMSALARHTNEHIQVVHPNVIPGKTSGLAMDYVPAVIQNKLKKKLKDWTVDKLSEYLMTQTNEFIMAADADADGVTVCITMEAPSDFNALGQLINFKKVQIPDNLFPEKSLDMIINTKPGYHYV